MPEKFHWGGISDAVKLYVQFTMPNIFLLKFLCILKLLLWGKVLRSRPIWTLTYKDLLLPPPSLVLPCPIYWLFCCCSFFWVLFCFLLCQLDISYHHLGRKNHNQENVSIVLPDRQVCKTFSWSMFDEGLPSSLWTS